jgi:hypothetical protein
MRINNKRHIVKHFLLLSLMRIIADLSIGLFENKELTAFGLDPPQKKNAYSLIKGDSCNCQMIDYFIPHAHCTHTETIHHIHCGYSKTSVEIIKSIPFLTRFFIINYEELFQTERKRESESLAIRFNKLPPYGQQSPHMNPRDIEFILERFPNVKHLLVDLPSLEAVDDARMICHKRFFESVPEGTITEICNFSALSTYKGEKLRLQLAVFPISGSDAHPSRPLLIG